MKKNSKISNLVFASLFSAIISVISQIYIMTPFGIPITLQIFAVSLCGFFLGAKWGIASVLTYISAGILGLPVFSGFRGGIQHILSPTGGFITGFIFLVFLCGIARKNKFISVISGIWGVLTCHLIGIIQFAFTTNTGFIPSFITASLPFLIKDIISVVVAFGLSVTLNKYISLHNKNV